MTPPQDNPKQVAGDIEEFFEDAGDLDAGRRNAALARLLLGTLHAHSIIIIERMDSAAQKGWRVVYRVRG